MRFLKKIALVILVSLLVLSIANAQIGIVKDIPEEFKVREASTVQITIKPVSYESFDIAELLPVGWEISSWEASGNFSMVILEHTKTSYLDSVREVYTWSSTGPTNQDIVITYTFTPRSVGTYNITTVTTYSPPPGFDTEDMQVSVVSPKLLSECGNNICEALYGETYITCSEDCGLEARENALVMLAILLIALMIMFAGLVYREYQKMRIPKKENGAVFEKAGAWSKIRKQKVQKKMISEKETEYTLPRAKPIIYSDIMRAMVKPSKTVKKKKAKKKVKKKPKKVKKRKIRRKVKKVKRKIKRKTVKRKAKKKKSRPKHSAFYKKTMKRLQKLNKSL